MQTYPQTRQSYSPRTREEVQEEILHVENIVWQARLKLERLYYELEREAIIRIGKNLTQNDAQDRPA